MVAVLLRVVASALVVFFPTVGAGTRIQILTAVTTHRVLVVGHGGRAPKLVIQWNGATVIAAVLLGAGPFASLSADAIVAAIIAAHHLSGRATRWITGHLGTDPVSRCITGAGVTPIVRGLLLPGGTRLRAGHLGAGPVSILIAGTGVATIIRLLLLARGARLITYLLGTNPQSVLVAGAGVTVIAGLLLLPRRTDARVARHLGTGPVSVLIAGTGVAAIVRLLLLTGQTGGCATYFGAAPVAVWVTRAGVAAISGVFLLAGRTRRRVAIHLSADPQAIVTTGARVTVVSRGCLRARNT